MNTEQILGLITGIFFGFLLQKARVLRFDKQVGAMLLKDMTIFKFMLSAILVGMIGIQLLAGFEVIKLSHKPMNLGAILLGGSLFGMGWAVMGFCPGTSIGAIAEGRWHALFAVAGMITGAAIYAELYPILKSTILSLKDFGKLGLSEITGLKPGILVVIFWAAVIPLLIWFEKKKL